MGDDMGTKETSKICGVCGDRALGCNFNAVCCESCKAFFRRNATKNKDFHCPFVKNCKINPVTRRFCQKCRLEKCFSIGMLKESIMSEKDKALKRQKIELNRAKRRRISDKSKESDEVKKKIHSLDEESTLAIESSITSIYASEINFWDSEKKNPYFDSDKIQEIISSPHGCENEINVLSMASKLDLDEYDVQSISSLPRTCPLSKDNSVHYSETSKGTPKPLKNSRSKKLPTNPLNFALRIVENPQLFSEIMSRPNFASKVLENNREFLLKILSEPKFLLALISDPQILAIMDEKENNQFLDSNIKDSSKNELENKPIFSGLIGNGNSEAHSTTDVTPDSGKSMDCITSTNEDIRDVRRMPMSANSIEFVLGEAIKLEFSAYSIYSSNNTRELNDPERAKLNELIVAHKALLAPLDDDISSLVGEESSFKNDSKGSDPALLDLINLTAIAIRRLIKMSKKISAFKNMCQEDQVALLKGGCTEMMMLRSAINYDADKDTWNILRSQDSISAIKVDILKEVKGNLYEEHARFISTFDPRWRDENIILILSAIALFTPDRPKVVHSDVVKLEQNSYYYLLRRYLESMYQGCEAKSMFLKLIQKISELHKLNDEVVRVYLNVNPSSVEPLLIEIFDLKR